MRVKTRPQVPSSYDGLLDPSLIHASSTRLGWRDITVNSDILPAGFRPPQMQAFRDHHIVVNTDRRRKCFEYSADGARSTSVKVMRPWDFIFVPATTKWDWNILDDSRILSIRVRDEILTDLALRPEFGSGRFGCKFTKVVDIARALRDELEQQTRFTPKAVDAHRALLAIELAKRFTVTTKPAGRPVPTPDHGGIAAALGTIKAWVESRNLTRHPKVSDLAEAAGVSTRTFQREFRDAPENPQRRTPLQFMYQCMMEEAKTALRQPASLRGAARVGEVASSFGFSDVRHFSAVFKGVTGHLPSWYLPSD